MASLSRSQSFRVDGSGREDPFPRLQIHVQTVLACFRKLSSIVYGNKALERLNAKF